MAESKWLQIPQGAAELLQPYIRSNTKFFVAKVNLGEYKKTVLLFASVTNGI